MRLDLHHRTGDLRYPYTVISSWPQFSSSGPELKEDLSSSFLVSHTIFVAYLAVILII